jgi:hypothetical protein
MIARSPGAEEAEAWSEVLPAFEICFFDTIGLVAGLKQKMLYHRLYEVVCVLILGNIKDP